MEHAKATENDSTPSSPHAEQQQQQNQQSDNPSNAFANTLSDSTVAIGASLQNMQQMLVGNVQHVAQMTLSMNSMMEEMVKRAISTGVFAGPDTDVLEHGKEDSGSDRFSAALRIFVTNNSPIPLVGMRATLLFSQYKSKDRIDDHSAQSRRGVRIASTYVSSLVSGGEDPGEGARKEPFLEFETLKPTSLPPVDNGTHDRDKSCSVEQNSKPTSLSSGVTARSAVRVSVDQLRQLDCQITITFTSPGTGNAVSITQRFGVYLMHLFLGANRRYYCAAEDVAAKLGGQIEPVLPTDGQSSSIHVDLIYLRSAFCVPPADGIGVGSVFIIMTDRSTGGLVLGLRVVDIDAELQRAECEWISGSVADDREYLSKDELGNILPLLAKELDMEIR
ncbi:hypothetical protein GGI11_003637 [Coemansia sp. RSA 2049]|nr:hypothetical protein GGI11_003637 [Coemansia sp. RSA 2049]KAJ2523181.1 hypothetical protein H4217_000248 [Coemansia sp. RSA 1939]KAJ2617920.1 hypothetical protein EV177_000297 [Coemansia sp. RSA 1804]